MQTNNFILFSKTLECKIHVDVYKDASSVQEISNFFKPEITHEYLHQGRLLTSRSLGIEAFPESCINTGYFLHRTIFYIF